LNGMEALRTAAPYLSQFRGQAFVVKLGGEVMEAPAALRNVCEQIALLWHLGMRVVIVHGGGTAIDEFSHKLGVRVKKVAGRRVTSDEALDVVKMKLAGETHVNLLSALRGVGLPVVGLSGLDAGLLVSEKRPPVEIEEDGEKKLIDFGWVGDIRKVNADLLTFALNGGYLPVVAPISASEEGQVYNTNADSAAAEIAIALGAEKLVFLLNVPGLLRDVNQPETVIPFLRSDEISEILHQGIASKGMLPKLNAARDAIKKGVHSVHFVSGLATDALLAEVFTNEGSGTMIRKEAGA
jgi:acetylglutamate kinase